MKDVSAESQHESTPESGRTSSSFRLPPSSLPLHAVLNFLKPPGMTSHDAVSFVRRLAETKRVGHTGTLDPAAAGVLPICIGNATKLADYLQAGRKTYIAEATFGTETDSLDATGETVFTGDARALNEQHINDALAPFRGDILQTPPLFSAVKKDGKKLYQLAREGQSIERGEVEVAAREVQIYKLEMTRFFTHEKFPRAIFHIECGSGTYIRSLVRDIGRALGCFATMSFLVRTQSGDFHIDNARTPQELESDFVSSLVPFQSALESCASRVVTDDEVVAEYLAGRTRRSREAENKHRTSDERLLFVDAARRHGLLCDGQTSKLFHLQNLQEDKT